MSTHCQLCFVLLLLQQQPRCYRCLLLVLLVLVLAAIGLPVLSGGRGGLAVFMAPTTGYLIGWVFAAMVTGYLSQIMVGRDQAGLVQGVNFFIAALMGGVIVPGEFRALLDRYLAR